MGVECFCKEGKNNDIKTEAVFPGNANYISFEELSIIKRQKEKNVFKIIKNNKLIGTGFFCYIPYPNKANLLPVLFTCNHVLRNADLKNGKEINLLFNDQVTKVLKMNQLRAIYTSGENEYDVTIIEIKKNDNFDLNHLLELDYDIYQDHLDNIYKDKSIYIIHYPKGKESSYSDSTIKNIDINNTKIYHLCSTDEGSSGAPILNLKNFSVLGIHLGRHKNNKVNVGIILRTPIDEFIKLNKPSNDKTSFQTYLELNKNKKIEEEKKNEIVIKVEVSEEDIYKNVYFLDQFSQDNDPFCYEKVSSDNNEDKSDGKIFVVMNLEKMNYLKELDESNVKLFINDKLHKYKKFFVPTKEGIYTIKLKFNIKMTDCSHMFEKCEKIIDIDLSNFDASEVKDMSYMFSWCIKLENLNLSSLNTGKVEHMNAMFNYCSHLESLDLSSFNTKNVIDMSYMFGTCEYLTSITLSSFDTKKVKDMRFMFYNCKNLTSLDLSSFVCGKELNSYMMFCNCDNLEEVNANEEIKKNLNDKKHFLFS